jgi:PAS domain S-box-containing protein
MVDVTARVAADRGNSLPGQVVRGRLPSLRAHLVGLLLASLMPTMAIGGAASWYLADSYRTAFESRLQDTARALALYLDEEIESRLNAVASIAASPLLAGDDLSAFRRWARQTGEILEGWVILHEAAPGHQQIVNTALPDGAPFPPPAPPGEGAWHVLRRAVETGRPAVSNLFTGRASGRPSLAVAAPVMMGGRISRVVVLSLDPTRLAARLRDYAPSGGAYVSVADGEGRIVARSRDHERYIGTIPPSRSVSATERAGRVFTANSVYGDRTLFSAQPLRVAAGWSVVVGEPYARYRATWLWPLAVVAGTAAAALAIGLGIAAALARRILRPVTALVARGNSIAAGNGRAEAIPPAQVAEFEALRAASEKAEMALATREAEFRAIFETAAAGVVELDAATGRYLRVNRRFCEIAGRPAEALVGLIGPRDVCHPADRTKLPAARALEQDGGAEGEYRIIRPDNSIVQVLASVDISARDAAGRATRLVSVMQDVTERRRAEAARELLTREVDHRAKNALAVVHAALRLTPKTDVESYARAVEGRVMALARAQTLLAESRWAGADLLTLAEGELGAFAAPRNGERGVVLDGPALALSPAASQSLAMALHELATNATKHGALSAEGGRVTLSWRLDAAAGMLCLRWVEEGGPAPDGAPQRRGFGSRVIAAMIEDQLGGTQGQAWEPAGLVWQARVPASRALARAADAGEEAAARGAAGLLGVEAP